MQLVQPDLFHLDSPLYGEVRGERSIMAFPFFALTKIAQMKPLEYKGGNISIEVRPSASGVATIYDKEIVLYIASLMVAKIEAGEPVDQDFTFTAHDFFRVTGTSSSSRSYERLADALERLQGTQIRTNIEAGGEGEEGWFSWLSEAKTQYTRGKNGEKRLKAVRVRLCDWLHRAIIKDRRILTYHLDYFRLGPIERRLYELARSHCDGADPYEVELEVLRHQVGSQDTLPRFKHALKSIAEADTMPEYHIVLKDMPPEPQLGLEGALPKRRRGRREVGTLVVITPRSRPLPRRALLGAAIEAVAA
jgi:plasmid replication initiation protein